MKLILLFLSLVSVCALLASADKMVLLEERVILVDSYLPSSANTCQNLLFRSNLPFDAADNFAYEELRAFMTKAAAKHKITMPSNFVLQSYNLMKSDGTEGHYSKLEKAFFTSNPSLGQSYQNSIHGTSTGSPSSYDAAHIKSKVEDWDKNFDDKHYNAFIDRIRANVTQPCQRVTHEDGTHELIPTVTLIHCMHGRDRTGQVSGSYMMKFMHLSFPQVSALDYEAGGLDSPIVFGNQRTIDWYCYFLQDVKEYDPLMLQCNKEENMDSKHRVKPLMFEWDAQSEDSWSWPSVLGLSIGELAAVILAVVAVGFVVFAVWKVRKVRLARLANSCSSSTSCATSFHQLEDPSLPNCAPNTADNEEDAESCKLTVSGGLLDNPPEYEDDRQSIV